MGLENSTCDRCNSKATTLKGSFFNTDMICLNCNQKEMEHKDYSLAKEKELEEVKNGNYNFEGIGLPLDLK